MIDQKKKVMDIWKKTENVRIARETKENKFNSTMTDTMKQKVIN